MLGWRRCGHPRLDGWRLGRGDWGRGADGGLGGADLAGELDQADRGHHHEAVDRQGQQVFRPVFAVRGGDAGHVPVGDPEGDAGDEPEAGHADSREPPAADGYPGDRLDGGEHGHRWPPGDDLVNEQVPGVQDVRGEAGADPEGQGEADAPAHPA